MERQLYRTSWQFVDRASADKTVYEMFQKAMAETTLFRHKQLFFQYAMFLYLAGARRVEPFLSPVSVIKMSEKGGLFYKVQHQNAKHFSSTKIVCKICEQGFNSIKKLHTHQVETSHKGFQYMASRKMLSSIFYVFGSYEAAMFRYITNDKQQIRLDFTPLLPPRAQSAIVDGEVVDMQLLESGVAKLTRKFKIFKADITDGNQVYKNSSISPHQLRHLRAYDLLANHSIPLHLAQKLLGWNSSDMAVRYADIAGVINDAETMAMWQNVLNKPSTIETSTALFNHMP